MTYLYQILLVVLSVSFITAQQFTEESPYMLIRLMDMKVNEWKPDTLDKMEQLLDEELKYADARKGTECRSIDFVQEAGYPIGENRFLDLSIRGLCTDLEGKIHKIEKELIIVAIERQINEVNALLGATVYKIGNVQIYKRDRNLLNLIIIPVSFGLIVLLALITFCLRRFRYAQKERHIVAKLQEKREASEKKVQTIANVDPHASEKQRLLQLDPTVVGSASDTLGSPKEFTQEQYFKPSRNNTNQEYPSGSSSVTFKDNRPSHERMHVPYENQSRSPMGHYSSERSDAIPLQEQQPRVVVRTIRDDGNQPSYYQQNEHSPTKFIPIPVQIERSDPHQRYVSPPYHSDPYYRQGNS